MSASTPSQQHASIATGEYRDHFDRLILHNLTEKLRIIEQRLGTPAEHHDDEALARELGHDIRNHLNLLQMREEFRELLLSKAPVLQQTA